MAVHQLLSYARRGDAVTHQALALRDAFDVAEESLVIAHAFDDSVRDDVVALADVTDRMIAPDDLVLYHVTIGCESATTWVLERDGPFGLAYHNITPPRFFEHVSWDHARLTEQGRSELAVLVPQATVIVADSTFNAAEIEALGGTVAAVHPPLGSTRRLADLADDRRLARELTRNAGPTFVHIGQRLPHKRTHELVLALHLLTDHIGTPADLTLIGASPVPAYDRVVTDLIDELVPDRCMATGMIPDRAVATRLRHATAFVTTSVHEGFCVPIVEAMAMGVPVLACDAGAVEETAGGAALLLPAGAAPTLVAEALHALATDDDLREDLSRRGRRRAAELDETIDLRRLARVITTQA